MLLKVSQLIVISLLCLVGCSQSASNDSGSDRPSNISTGEIDVHGCWQGSVGSADPNVGSSVKDTHILEPGGNYSGNREIWGGQTGRTVTNYNGEWAIDDGYILIKDNTRDGTITLKVISQYELRSTSDTKYSRC